MSRSGYSGDGDDCDNPGLWRGAVERAIRGKRGQAFLQEMAAALDGMPVKKLVAGEIVRDSEHVCAIGSVAVARKTDLPEMDIYDADKVARAFGIAPAMVCEIAFENDENGPWDKEETSAARWVRMRAWVSDQLITQ